MSIFTWAQLCNRLLTLKLGNNYHESAPWQQKLISLTCTYANRRRWSRSCTVYAAAVCTVSTGGALTFGPVSTHNNPVRSGCLRLHGHSMRCVTDRDHSGVVQNLFYRMISVWEGQSWCTHFSKFTCGVFFVFFEISNSRRTASKFTQKLPDNKFLIRSFTYYAHTNYNT